MRGGEKGQHSGCEEKMDTLVSTGFSYDIQSSHAHQTHPQQRYAGTHSPAKRGERRDDLVTLCETHSRGPGNGDSGRGGSTESDHFLWLWFGECKAVYVESRLRGLEKGGGGRNSGEAAGCCLGGW